MELDNMRVFLLLDAGVCGLELTKERLDYGLIFSKERYSAHSFLKERNPNIAT